MKSGAGDDPFGDESDGDSGEDRTDDEPHSATDDGATENGADERTESGSAGDRPTDDPSPTLDASEIPWVLRRSAVKDDRPNVTQFFLRDETDRGERRLKNEVEELLDGDVYTLDLREAAYRVAMRHPEEIAEELRSWGYDYLD